MKSDQQILKFAKCATKRRYATFAAAREQPGQHVYWCRICEGFHRTSWPQSAPDELLTQQMAQRTGAAV